MYRCKPKECLNKTKSWYGYIILGASFLTLMIVYGAQYSFGVFLKPILTEFDWTRAVTAGAYSVNFIFFGLWSIFTGRVADRFGSRVVVTGSGLLVSCSYLLMSQITTIWQMYLVYGVLLSLGVAGTFVPVFSTIARWFIAKGGLASGIASAGIGIGVIGMPPLANLLITTYSWRISFIVVACIALVIPAIAQLLKREPAWSYEVIGQNRDRKLNKANLGEGGCSVKQATRTRNFWLIIVIFVCLGTCVQTVMVHIVAYATDRGISSTIAAGILSIIGVVSTLTKIGIGGAIDRFRSKPVWIAVGILMVISFLLLRLPIVLGAPIIFGMFFGTGYGGFAAAQSPTIAEYFGLTAHGSIYGIGIFALGIGGAIGPYVTGHIFDTTGSYNPAFYGCAIICAGVIILTILLKDDKKAVAQIYALN